MKLLRRIRALFQRQKLDADMAEELRAHLEMQEAENRGRGLSPDEARYAARRQFGGVEQIKERAREQRSGRWVEDLARDLRRSLRSLGKQRGFTATAVLTLALCVGANIAIFAVVDTVLLRPLPFAEPDRLVTVFNAYPGASLPRSETSFANYADRRGAIPALASMAIYQNADAAVGPAGAVRRMAAARVSPEFFATLGVPLARGRMFTDAEMVPGSDAVAVVTDGFWRKEFAADPAIVGRRFFQDGVDVTVIGVLPPDFRFLSDRPEFFRPAAEAPGQRLPAERHNNQWMMIARLAAGATQAGAQAQLDAFNQRQLGDDPFAELVQKAGYRSFVRPLRTDQVEAVKPMLLLLQAGVLFLLLIGAANLTNLVLIRASGRAKELAVRQALGATPWRLAREVAVETLLLALAGGALGLVFGALGVRLLAALGADRLPLAAAIVFDGRAAWVSLAVSAVVGVLLALPVIGLNLRARLAPSLQLETRGGTAGPGAHRLRHGFIVAQVALAFVLLSAASLLGLSLKRVLETPTGFNSNPVLTARLAPSSRLQDGAARRELVRRLLSVLRALPGVQAVAISTRLPLGPVGDDSATRTENSELKPGESIRTHYHIWVRGDYWAAMGIPLLRGRLLGEADNENPQRVCVVDEAFAQRYWPGLDPVGRRLAPNGEFHEDNAFTVVGVVGEVKQRDLAEAAGHGTVYFPSLTLPATSIYLIVRTAVTPAAAGPEVQKAVRAAVPEVLIDDVRPMRARIDETLTARRSPTLLAAAFAGLALLLAALGTYGVLAYAVGQRRREIGVRLALGALPRRILGQILAQGLKLLLAGLGLGLLGAWATLRAMSGLLAGIGPVPWEILALTAAVMGAVVLLASLLPARRAARVSPLEALRAE